MSISAAGFGIPYREDNEPPPDPAAYAAVVKRATRDLGCKLIFEPGRMIVGNAGILVTRVIYVKRGEAKNFVIVDAAMNDLIRPTLYEAYHDIRPVQEPATRCSADQRPMWSVRSARRAIILRSTGRWPEPAPGRSARGHDRRRLWGRPGRDLQYARAGARSAGRTAPNGRWCGRALEIDALISLDRMPNWLTCDSLSHRPAESRTRPHVVE